MWQEQLPSTAAPRPAEGAAPPPAKSESTVRQYLESTVVNVVQAGMSELVKVKPADPCQFLADYLIRNNPMKKAAS